MRKMLNFVGRTRRPRAGNACRRNRSPRTLEPLEHRTLLSGYGETIEPVSVASGGALGDGLSRWPDLSGDGRYVAFESYADNLVAGDTNGCVDVFVYDRLNDAVERVSVASGGGQANGSSYRPAISDDGRYVAIQSHASNLTPGDGNGLCDVFLYDRQSDTIQRVSVGEGGAAGNGASHSAAVSGNGAYVAFVSSAANLVSGDTNGVADVFVWNRQSGTTERVSVAAGGAQAEAYSHGPALSRDGRYVAFASYASNLVPGDSNNVCDVFIFDRQEAATQRVAAAGAQPNNYSYHPSLSGDGRYVAFASAATNLVEGDTGAADDIFIFDRISGALDRVSTGMEGAEAAGHSDRPVLSGDGRYVAFQSLAANLVPNDANGAADVFLVDRSAGSTERVSVAADGAEGNGPSEGAAFSNDGRYVAFASSASNLAAADANAASDAFVAAASTAALGDTVAVYDPTAGDFFLRQSNTAGFGDLSFGYGAGGPLWLPIVGDWDGDGIDTVGLYDQAGGNFYLRNLNDSGFADLTFRFAPVDYSGPAGAGRLPVVGDWDGNGTDTIGFYDSATATFYLRNANGEGQADSTFVYGAAPSGWQPLAGDWDGNGTDSIGLYDPATGEFHLKHALGAGPADLVFVYGVGGAQWQPLAHDWDGNGADTPGVYDPRGSRFYLRNANSAGPADLEFVYGAGGLGWQPMAGNWTGTLAAPLAAAGGWLGATNDLAPLRADQLQPIVDRAVADWADLGLAAEHLANLAAVRFAVADLPGAQVGLANRNTILLDLDAAGRGWFVDPTPGASEEFAADSARGGLRAIDPAAVDRIDLLTAVGHELGHVLGLADLDASLDDLMSGALPTGLRRCPTHVEFDAVFGRM